MIRHDPIGTDEAWTPAARQRLMRDLIGVAARPVGARIARDGSAATATQLDRPSAPLIVQAMTATLRPSTLDPYAGSATPVLKIPPYVADADVALCVAGVNPYLFAIPAAGTLRAIRCRDYLYTTPFRDTADPATITRIRVRLMNSSGGGPLSIILDGSTGNCPFDISTFNTAIGGIGTDLIEVVATDGGGVVINKILSVEFEFAVGLVSP